MYGLGVYASDWAGLVIDDTGFPSWLPLYLFDIVDPTLPRGWVIGWDRDAVADARQWQAVLGYPMLVQNEEHFDGILLRDADQLALFHQLRPDA